MLVLAYKFAQRYLVQMVFLVSAVAAPVLCTAQTAQGETRCYRGERNADDGVSLCRVAWEFPDESGAFKYWVQRLEVDESGIDWVAVDGPHRTNPGVLPNEAEGGFLYRVVSCDDTATNPTPRCNTSTAIWAPVVFDGYEDIPRTVKMKDGSTVVSMGALNPAEEPIDFLNIEYNLALIFRLASFVDSSALPHLTELPFENIHNVPPGFSKWDAYMDFNVGAAYPVDPIDPYSHPYSE